MIYILWLNYLDENNVHYNIINHPIAFTAQGIAHAAHISGKMFAKSVLLKVDGKLTMMVLPAHMKIDIEAVKGYFKADDVTMASESEFKSYFPDCEIGGMPPFGHLYGLDVYVSKELSNDNYIAFNAGNHSELVVISFLDFKKLESPTVMDFTYVDNFDKLDY